MYINRDVPILFAMTFHSPDAQRLRGLYLRPLDARDFLHLTRTLPANGRANNVSAMLDDHASPAHAVRRPWTMVYSVNCI